MSKSQGHCPVHALHGAHQLVAAALTPELVQIHIEPRGSKGTVYVFPTNPPKKKTRNLCVAPLPLPPKPMLCCMQGGEQHVLLVERKMPENLRQKVSLFMVDRKTTENQKRPTTLSASHQCGNGTMGPRLR